MIVAEVVLMEPAVTLPVTVNALKLPRLVMLLSVPVLNVPLKVPPVMVPGTVRLPIVAVVLLILPELTEPLTVRLLKVPMPVILGWSAVVSVPAKVVAVKPPFTVKDVRPVRLLIVAEVVLIEPAVTLPVTVNALKLPRLVILFNVPLDRVPLNVPPVIVPGTVKLPIVAVVELRLPEFSEPLTVRLVSVPMPVILGCTPVVSVPLIVDIFAKPVTVILLKVEIPVIPAKVPGDKVPLIIPASIVPVTDKLLNLPSEVIFGCIPVVRVPASVAALIAPLVVTEVGVMFPKLIVMAGVVVELATVADMPLASTTDTAVTPVAGTFPVRT